MSSSVTLVKFWSALATSQGTSETLCCHIEILFLFCKICVIAAKLNDLPLERGTRVFRAVP